jgi:hypothetical protein
MSQPGITTHPPLLVDLHIHPTPGLDPRAPRPDGRARGGAHRPRRNARPDAQDRLLARQSQARSTRVRATVPQGQNAPQAQASGQAHARQGPRRKHPGSGTGILRRRKRTCAGSQRLLLLRRRLRTRMRRRRDPDPVTQWQGPAVSRHHRNGIGSRRRGMRRRPRRALLHSTSPRHQGTVVRSLLEHQLELHLRRRLTAILTTAQ